MRTKLKLIKIEDLNGNTWFQIIHNNMCLSLHVIESEAIKEFKLVAERLKKRYQKAKR